MDKNAPEIYIYGSSGSNGNDQGARVRITYTREREDRGQNRADGDWICQMVRISPAAAIPKANGLVYNVKLCLTHEMFSMPGAQNRYAIHTSFKSQ